MKRLLILVSLAILMFNTGLGGTIKDKNGNIVFATFEGQDQQRLTVLKGESLLKQLLPLKESDNYSRVSESLDALGMSHERFQQFYGQIPVEFGVFTLHYSNGKATSAAGEYILIDETCPKMPTLTTIDAFELAKKHVGATKYMWEDEEMETFIKTDMNDQDATFFPEAKLVYVKDIIGGNEKARLAFKFDIYAQMPISRGDIYVDAITGKILFVQNKIHHADEIGTAETRYVGTKSITTFNTGTLFQLKESGSRKCETYNLKRTENYGGAKLFNDTDNNWTATEYNNGRKDNAALDAHYGAERSWDYWKDIHGRNSYDGLGGTIKSFVHFGVNYDNAFWDGQRMTYGDGSGEIFDALTSLDVCAHEIGHGVCEKTANLIYAGESGAMNEGFSDIWAACIEYHNGRTQEQIWKIGEDIERRPDHIALRVMSNPKLEKNPDTYLGEYWFDQVHNTSGVFNYWFYLLSMGGSGVNDNLNNYNVAGISIEKAEKIAFRAEKEYMTPTTDFIQAREITLQCAKDLYGVNAPEVKSVDDAWYAVGIAGPCFDSDNTTDWQYKFINVGNNTATFYIENNPEIEGKIIVTYIDQDSVFSNTPINAENISGDTFRIVGLKKCTTYVLNGKLICNSGIAIQTNLMNTFKTKGCVCLPVEELRVDFVSLFTTNVILKSAGPADSIELSYRIVGTNNWLSRKFFNYPGDFDEFLFLEKLMPNTDYELKARFFCNVIWQDYSASIFFKTLEAECGRSNNFQATSIYLTSATFSLEPFNGIVSEKIKYKAVGEMEYKEVNYDFVTNYFYLNMLLPNTDYMTFVESTCYDSTIYNSDTIYFKTKAFTCTTPNELYLIGEANPTDATFNWWSQEGAEEYFLYYKPITSANFISKSTGTDTFYTITGLTPGQFYMAKERPKCGGTLRNQSVIVYFITPLTTGVNQNKTELISLGIYPNPTNGNVKIVSNKSMGDKVIQIVDIMGKLVMEKTIQLEQSNPIELDLTSLSQGTYFIYTDFEGYKIANKVMVNR